MNRPRMAAAVFGAAVLFAAGAVRAQSPAANPLDTIPDKMPFSQPYGAPITLGEAQHVIAAAMAEAERRGWPGNIAVVDSGGNLVAFVRMDGAQLGSIPVAQHKARVAVKYRRPTRVFEDGVQKSGLNYVLSLDDVIASRGGIPLVVDGHIVGAIGCSGGTGSQDEVICTAGANSLGKP
jgi:glc operon protein GlcG